MKKKKTIVLPSFSGGYNKESCIHMHSFAMYLNFRYRKRLVALLFLRIQQTILQILIFLASSNTFPSSSATLTVAPARHRFPDSTLRRFPVLSILQAPTWLLQLCPSLQRHLRRTEFSCIRSPCTAPSTETESAPLVLRILVTFPLNSFRHVSNFIVFSTPA